MKKMEESRNFKANKYSMHGYVYIRTKGNVYMIVWPYAFECRAICEMCMVQWPGFSQKMIFKWTHCKCKVPTTQT